MLLLAVKVCRVLSGGYYKEVIMTVGFSKKKFVVGLAFMITMFSSEAHAFGFPVLCADMKRLIASARVTMQQVMIIKQEIDSNMRIIQEIQNGGFASAGAMIFDKIQNGDYDRFGQALTTMKAEGQNMSDNVKARKAYKEAEQEALKNGMDEKQAKAAAQQAMSKSLEESRANRIQQAAEAKKNRGSNAFSSSYNWLKKNSGVTSGASSALRGVESGNWGQVLSGASGVTGSAINSGGESAVGNIFNGASNNAGNALNSALNGDWGSAFNSAAQGTGNAVTGATGSEGMGSAIGSLGNFGEGVYNTVGNGGNLGEVVSGIANNGQIESGLSGITGGYNQMQDEQNAAAEAKAEADRKYGEEQRKKNQEAFDKYEKEKKCNDCMTNVIKTGGSQVEAGMKCISYCQ